MKTIGLLGGMSWESTLQYYKALNTGVNDALGGLHSARIVMHSVDFGPIETLMQNDQWLEIETILGDAVSGLEKAGADFFLICTNTMHKLAGEIESRVSIPLLHICDATAEVLLNSTMRRFGLLGTSFTMEQDFYRGRLSERYGLEVLVPEKDDRNIINDVIFNELCCGKTEEHSKREYIRIIELLVDQGAEGIILGCTEIGMLVQQQDVDVQLFDTTAIHTAKAVTMALADEKLAEK